MTNRNEFKLKLMSILLDILTSNKYEQVILCDVLTEEDVPGSIALDILGATFWKPNNESDVCEDVLYLSIPELAVEITHKFDGVIKASKICDALINTLFMLYGKR
jgi:hypothetical protein